MRPPGNGGTVPLPTAESDGLRWLARGGHTDDWISTGHEDALSPVLFGLLSLGDVERRPLEARGAPGRVGMAAPLG